MRQTCVQGTGCDTEIELPPSNYDDHLVQVPSFGRSWPPTLNPPRIGPTEFQDPSSNCLIREVETTLGKQVLNVPIAQRETAIQPDGMLDDDRRKAVTTVRYLAHSETLKHRPCRSHGVNVTMPPAVVIPVLTQHYAMLRRNLLYTGVTRGKRLVVLVGQKKAVAIAVRNASGRQRWSKLDEWLAGANDGTETEFAPDARSLREPPLTGAMPYGNRGAGQDRIGWWGLKNG